MRTSWWIGMTWAFVVSVGTTACGSSDDDSGSTGGTTATGGGTAIGGSAGAGAGTATGGAMGSGGSGGGSGTQTLMGSCNLVAMEFCMDYYCIDPTGVCAVYTQSMSENCATGLGGVWSTSACATTDTLGSCTSHDQLGDFVTTYYTGSYPSAAQAADSCSSPDVWTPA
jgi:hypothetical protein